MHTPEEILQVFDSSFAACFALVEDCAPGARMQLFGKIWEINPDAIITEADLFVVQAEVVRWIYDMYISGCGCLAIANTLNEAGIPNGKGNPRRPNNILQLISNEKYMGDVMMGKSVCIDGAKCDNLDGRFGERYYIENAHEGIVSKEIFYRAQAIRQERANPKLVKQEHPSYSFTGMIVCGCCGSTCFDSGIFREEGTHVYCHSRKDGKEGCVYLVINNSWTETTTVELSGEAEVYALTGKTGMRSRTMCLNGQELVLGENDELPELIGVTASGKVEIAPGSCTFIVL